MSIGRLIFSLFVSFLAVATKNTYPKIITGEYASKLFKWYDIILFISFAYIIYQTIGYLKNKKFDIFKVKKNSKLKKYEKYITYKNIFLAVTGVYLINFIINYTDTMMVTTESIWYASVIDSVSNANPVINTFFLQPGIWLYKVTGEALYGILANAIILLIFNIALYTLLNCYVWKKSKNIKYLLFTFLWTMFLPIIFTFQGYVWKDTYFVNFSVIFMILLYEILDSNFKKLDKLSFFMLFVFFTTITLLIRNNIFVPFCILFGVIILFFKKVGKKFILSLFIILMCYLGMTKFVLPHFYVHETNKAEFAGLKLSFLSRIIKEDFEIDKDDKTFLNMVMFDTEIKEDYNPNCIDSIKFNSYFNNEFLNENYGEFNSIFGKYVKKYPLELVKTLTISTYQIWSLYLPEYTAGNVWYFISKVPILNLITCPMFYIILLSFLIFKYRKSNFWIYPILILAIYGFLCGGVPVNVAIRYYYIVFPNIVLLLMPLLDLKKKNN